MPDISIIIPTYNRYKVLESAIDSVFKQTHSNFELIVIDDGSNDNTGDFLKSIQDKRLRSFYQNNKGVSSARNLGIKNANSKLIAFLDSDDIWLPQKLEKHLNYIQNNPQYKISQTDEIWIRNGKRVNPKKKHKKQSGYIYNESLALCLISPSSVIIDKSIFDDVGLFDETFLACEDYDLWLRITCKYQVGLLNEKLIIKYGGHEDQLSKKYPAMDKFRVKALTKILKSNCLNNEERKNTIAILQQKCKIIINGALKRGNKAEAKKYEMNNRGQTFWSLEV